LNGLPGPASRPPVFASAQDGWVQVGAQLYASHDGGDSWQVDSLELPAGGSVVLVQAVVSPGGWAALIFEGATPSGQVPHGVEIWVAASTGGGGMWQPSVQTPEIQSPDAANWYPPRFSDARHAWLTVGPDMYTTADSGRTWNRRNMPPGASCLDVTPVTASTAWCAGRTPAGAYPNGSQVHLYRTVDGGRYWSTVDPPI